MSQQTLKS